MNTNMFTAVKAKNKDGFLVIPRDPSKMLCPNYLLEGEMKAFQVRLIADTEEEALKFAAENFVLVDDPSYYQRG